MSTIFEMAKSFGYVFALWVYGCKKIFIVEHKCPKTSLPLFFIENLYSFLNILGIIRLTEYFHSNLGCLKAAKATEGQDGVKLY